MLIHCPHCGFRREVPDSSIPENAARILCPKCRERFDFKRPEERESPEAAGSAENSAQTAQDNEPGTPDPAAESGLPEPTTERAADIDGDASFDEELPPGAAPPAGFWIRVVASLIDTVLVTALQLLLVFVFGAATGFLMGASGYGQQEIAAALGLPGQLFAMAVGLLYYVFLTGYCGQTLGKKAMRIKVIAIDGSAVGYGAAFIREVPGKFISTVLFGFGYLMVAFTRRKQGLHDKLASTLVVKVP